MARDTLVRNTTAGPVVGFSDTQPIRSHSPALDGTEADGGREPVLKWLGVPFAKAGRFERPSDPEPWSQPREAFEFGTIFPQMTFPAMPAETNIVDRSWIQHSEDSFTLNVWAPRDSKMGDNLPVMVWVFGGGLELGSPSVGFTDPTELVRKYASLGKPVVVVAFEYRTNVFGFASHPELAKQDSQGLCGNYGLYDSVKAFEWVQNNVANFGGDPNNVTAFGGSAGAVIIGHLLIYDRSILFHKAMLASASACTIIIRPVESAYPTWNHVLKETGAVSVEDLRSVPADKLLAAHLSKPGFGNISLTIESGPYAVWSEPSLDKLRKGEWAPWIQSIVIGGVEHEGTAFGAKDSLHTRAGWEHFLSTFPADVQRKISERYLPGNGPHPDILPPTSAPACRLLAEQLFDGPIRQQCLAMSSTVNAQTGKACPVYLYRSSVTAKRWVPAALGSTHGIDQGNIFQLVDVLDDSELAAADVYAQWLSDYALNGSINDKWAQFKPSAPCAFAIAPDGKTSLIDLSDELADPLELSGPDVGIWTRYKWPQDWN